jgi:hypothetical protein
MHTSFVNLESPSKGVVCKQLTLGSLEALLKFSKNLALKIYVCGISIGPMCKQE